VPASCLSTAARNAQSTEDCQCWTSVRRSGQRTMSEGPLSAVQLEDSLKEINSDQFISRACRRPDRRSVLVTNIFAPGVSRTSSEADKGMHTPYTSSMLRCSTHRRCYEQAKVAAAAANPRSLDASAYISSEIHEEPAASMPQYRRRCTEASHERSAHQHAYTKRLRG
jgi:hypothetical protein